MSGAFPSIRAKHPERRLGALAGGGADPADGDGGAASAALERCIPRLEEVVDHESAALERREAVDLRELNNRKSQGLLDLMRCLRVFQGAAPSRPALARLAGLRAKLDRNRAVLALHLEAVREIATVMSDAIKDAESDGTYSPAVCGALSAYD
jgi:hypothetical protein